MEGIFDWVLGVVVASEDADGAAVDVAVLVEADLALQGLQVGRLNRVAHGIPSHRLARGRDPLDRVEDD